MKRGRRGGRRIRVIEREVGEGGGRVEGEGEEG